jgi:hypothetical protein
MLETDTIQELIEFATESLAYEAKQQRLLPVLAKQVQFCRDRIPSYRAYLEKMRFATEAFDSFADVPYLPSSAFKDFDLCAVPSSQVTRVLKSSATSTGVPSRIYLDKDTAFRQTKALAATLIEHIGSRRRPYLVLDCKEVNEDHTGLTARGAALRGLLSFASSVSYGLCQQEDQLQLDLEAIGAFFREHKGIPVLLSGFTYIMWTMVVQQLETLGICFSHPEMIVLHSGGWKHLGDMGVSKERFSQGVAHAFGCSPKCVRDFYGMIEQVGVVFVDCEAGNKHAPNFAEVLIRDFLTLQPVEPGQSGFIEVLSILPQSYPGQAILTEDVGVWLGSDGCPCGRPGAYFRFQSRVPHAELRGCGDTFAASQVIEAAAPQSAAHLAGNLQPRLQLVATAGPLRGLPEAPPPRAIRDAVMENFDEFARVPTSQIVALLDAVGREMAAPEFGKIEGIAFLSSWLREGNLRKVLELNFGDRTDALDAPVTYSGISLRAVPRGLVCHWVAGNAPTLALFSWALAALTKNASILRVPQESQGPVGLLFSAVERARIEHQGTICDGKMLMTRTCVVHFPSSDVATNHALSSLADLRIVWGGTDAVQAVTSYPRPDHCEDVVFGPKYSLGVADRLTIEDPSSLTGCLRNFVRDAVLFEQEACSSPQMLFLETSRTELERIADATEEEFRQIGRRFPKRSIDPSIAAQILRARACYGLGVDTSVRAPRDLSYTVLLEGKTVLRDALQSRTLTLVAIDDLMKLVPLLSPKIQTVGAAIADPVKRAAFAEAAALRGVARIVPPGLMNLYETPWDGMLPLNRLVRWCRS